MKWAKAMPMFAADGKTTTTFTVPQAIITDHGSHFRNITMTKISDQLGLCHDNSTPYYPQANGQVEAVNKVLTTMVKRIIGIHKSNWHTMCSSTLWAYRTSTKLQ